MVNPNFANNTDEMLFILKEVNPFLILGVAEDADLRTITKAYRVLAMSYHPDKFCHMAEEMKPRNLDVIFNKINLSFNILKDPESRSKYEEKLMRDKILANNKPFTPEKVRVPEEPDNYKNITFGGISSNKSAQKIKEELSEVLFQEGKKFFNSGHTDKAIENFRAAIEKRFDNAILHSYLGLAMKKKGWDGYAQAEFKLALRFDPNDKIANDNFSICKPEVKSEKGGVLGRFINNFIGRNKQ